MSLSHLDGAFGWPATAVVAILVAFLVLGGWLSRRRFAGLVRRIEREPGALDGFYRRIIATTWVLGLCVPLVLLIEPALTPADVGLRWPAGDGIDYAVALFLLFVIVLGGLRRRRQIQGGRLVAGGQLLVLLPRTASQRRLAALLSVTAGVVEEAVFRGLFIAAGVGVLGLPLSVSALLSIALFTWGHLYQGFGGMLGAAVLGVLFTSLYIHLGEPAAARDPAHRPGSGGPAIDPTQRWRFGTG